MFALDADITVYWPDVRPCWEERPDTMGLDGRSVDPMPRRLTCEP
jgi:hypothetical protein